MSVLWAESSFDVYPRPAIRENPANPDHHIWNNNGTWYIHFTLYDTPYTAVRIRRSLRTRCREEARRRRDEIFAWLRAGKLHPLVA